MSRGRPTTREGTSGVHGDRPPASTATEVEDDVQIHDPITETYSPAARHRLIAYDATVLARDFTKVPTGTKRRRKGEQPGFLVVQSKVAHAFYLVLVDNPDENKPLTKNLKKTIDDIPLPTRRVRYPIKIERVEAPDPGVHARANLCDRKMGRGLRLQDADPARG